MSFFLRREIGLLILGVISSCSSTPTRVIFPQDRSLAVGTDIGVTTAAWRSNSPILPLVKFGIEFQFNKSAQIGLNFQYLSTVGYFEPFLAVNSPLDSGGTQEAQVFVSVPSQKRWE